MDQYFVLNLSIFVYNGRLKNLQYKIKTSRCIFLFFWRKRARDSVILQQREFHGAIVNILMIYGVFLLLFMYEIT